MAMYTDSMRSPLEQVWKHFVPQDQALRNAFYNVAAVVFVGGAAAAAWSVYMMFQPFVQPLLWAVLFGSLLHPAKHAVTTWTKGWLWEVRSTHGLLSVSVALLPLRLMDTISEIVGRFVVQHVRSVIMVTVILPVVYIIIHYTPTVLTSLIYTIVSSVFYIISTVVSIVATNGYLVVALVMGYLGAVLFCWSDKTAHMLCRMSIPVWLMTAAGLSGIWPTVSVPLFIIMCLLLTAGLVIEVLDVHASRKAATDEEVSIIESALMVCLGDAASSQGDSPPSIQGADIKNPSELSPVTEEEDVEEIGEHGTASHLSTIPEQPTAPSHKEEAEDGDAERRAKFEEESLVEKTEEKVIDAEIKGKEEQKPQVPADTTYRTPSVESQRPNALLNTTLPSRARPSDGLLSPETRPINKIDSDDNGSNMYLKGVFVACILVELWRHNYLLPLLPLAMIYYLVKKLAARYLSWGLRGTALADGITSLYDNLKLFTALRRQAFLPPPITGVIKLFVRSDQHMILILSNAVDAIITLLLILAVIFFAVTASLFLAVQIQGESMALVTIGSQVINSTVVNNPQFLELLPEGLGDVVSSALDEGYLYGREWIASMLIEVEGCTHPTINATKVVRGMLGEHDEAKAAVLEKQVVELWDRVYQAWVAAHPQAPTAGPVVTSEAVALTFDSIVEGFRKTPASPPAGVVSFSFVSEVVKDNLGTVVSVLESVWSILLGNLSLAMSAVTAAASLLLGGSLSLLNALISVVVFMSSLFYVLSASESVYKPVAVLANLAPSQMNHLGKAVEDAVNGVFIASLKMGAFYGMWTWLLHTLFSTNVVYIPAVLGAIFGAVPLVGTYWAALPGALELCWSQGSPTLAALLFGAQLLPMSCVDTAIYADIKGGSHPYLTGLAVAGGIFYWGAEGAVLGPMLLCILKVATNIYTTLIQSPGDVTRRFGKLRRSQSELCV